MRCAIRISAAVVAAMTTTPALSQSFNVDLDAEVGAQFGEGLPSSTFGAAAGQPGHWNDYDGTAGPFALTDLNNQATGVTLSADGETFNLGANANLPGATTDQLLLLGDVGDPGTGLTFTFDGLAEGLYDVYTYAMGPDNPVWQAQVTVNGAAPQDVGGVFNGSFQQGVTHAMHSVSVNDGLLEISVGPSPNVPDPNFASVGGFQMVLIPAPTALPLLGLGMLVSGGRRRRLHD